MINAVERSLKKTGQKLHICTYQTLQESNVAGGSRTAAGGALGLRYAGAFILALNIAVAALSLSDMYLLASGAVRVGLPGPEDFGWRYDAGNASVVFEGNYTVKNNGFYDITDIDIAATVATASGVQMVSYRAAEARIPAFGGGRYPIVARMPAARLLYLDYGDMLFNATHFHLRVRVDAVYEMGLARFHADQALVIKWRPPLDSYARELFGGNLTDTIRGNLTLPQDIGSLEAWIATAMLANGTSVTVHGNGTDVTFRFEGGLLRVEVFDQNVPPAKLDEYSIAIPMSGGGR